MARVFRSAHPEVVTLRDVTKLGELLLVLRVDVVVAEGVPGVQALELARALQPEARRFLVVDRVPQHDDDQAQELVALQPCVVLTRAWLEGLMLDAAVARIPSMLAFGERP